MVYNLFSKRSPGGLATGARSETLVTRNKSAIKSEIIPLQQLAEELHKPIISKLGKRKVCSSFKANIWGVNITDMQIISKFNKGI